MARDIIGDGGSLFLGSRFKRLGERLQADVARIVQDHGLAVQPSQYPLLALIEQDGPITVGALADALRLSQPGVTRAINGLSAKGLVETSPLGHDQRHRHLSLTDAGRKAMALSRARIWPPIAAAVDEMCRDLTGPLLAQLDALEERLSSASLDQRAAKFRPSPALRLREFADHLATDFHDINAEWIRAMFTLEPTDREVLEHPRAQIIAPGGCILFVEAEGIGVVGTCALQKTGDRQFELTKMGVRESARGLKAGEFLLRAAINRADALGAERLYLLTSAKCAAAIHLYEKNGFVHSPAIMEDFGRRYARCDVAMLYAP